MLFFCVFFPPKATLIPSTQVLARLRRCAEINRSLHDHPNIINVHGIHVDHSRKLFCLILEKGAGSLRDIIHPNSKETQSLRDRVFASMSQKEIILEIFRGLT